MATIKKALLKLLSNLHGTDKLVSEKKIDLANAITLLQRKDRFQEEYIVINDNPPNQALAYEFLRLLFEEVNPELHNDANQKLINECVEDINNFDKFDKNDPAPPGFRTTS